MQLQLILTASEGPLTCECGYYFEQGAGPGMLFK